MNVAPGALLAGRFRLELPLGSGGMADVWRAQDLTTQRSVALKLPAGVRAVRVSPDGLVLYGAGRR